jgi:hypothetical protein
MRKWAAFFCALLLALTTACAAADTADNAGTTLLAINVGKADCLLVRSGVHAYLIDTGTEDAWGAISCALKLMGVAPLDGVIITNTDKDHGGGAVNVASAPIQVDAWYAPALYTGVKEAKHPAVKAAALRGQAVTWLRAGDTLPLGDGAMTVLGPVRLDAEKDGQVVQSVIYSPSAKLHLEVTPSHTQLAEGISYDMAAVRIRVLDEYGNIAPYAQLPVKLAVEGAAELVGPDVVTAEGGMCGTYIRTTGETGNATLTVSAPGLEEKKVVFTIA